MQAEADLAATKAAVDTARINLAYTRVTAPISGRIGRSSVTDGALVTASQAAALATIQQLDPIYVDVTQSTSELLRLKKSLSSGILKKAGRHRSNCSWKTALSTPRLEHSSFRKSRSIRAPAPSR